MAKLLFLIVRPLGQFTSTSRAISRQFSIWPNVAVSPLPARCHLHNPHVHWRALSTTGPYDRLRKGSSTWLALSSSKSNHISRQYSDKRIGDQDGKWPQEYPPCSPADVYKQLARRDASGVLAQRSDATEQGIKDLTKEVRSTLPSSTTHENIYNIPNVLTASRLIATPVIGYLVLHDQHKYALALFAYAGITDLVDGWIARRFNLQTVVGSVVDPMADKVLMTVLTVTLAMKGLLPAYLATLILGRDVALAVAALYYRYASLPAPKTFRRYWDFSLPSAEVHPTTMSKFNTFLQLLLIGSTLAYPVLTADSHHLGVMHDLGLGNISLENSMTYFQWIVAGTTAWSGLSYAYLKNAVKILGTDEKLKAKQGRNGRAIIGITFGSIVVAAAWLAISDGKPKAQELKDLVD